MAINLVPGDKIPLALLTETRVTGKFVRARVRDSSGVEIAGSPFTVPHLADGYYYSNTIATMPDTPYLTVEYDVFEEASFLTPSNLFPDGERFDRDDIADAINDLKNSGLRTTIEGDVEGSVELIGEVDADDLSSEVDKGSIDGQVVDSEFSSEIDSSSLEGDVECPM